MKSVSNVRTICVPMDHLTAELIALPFSSSSGFQGAVTGLDSSLKSRDTKSLWRETERILLQRFPNISIDELVARRDRAWFSSPEIANVPLENILRVVPDLVLDRDGRVARASVASQSIRSPDEKRRFWRWVSFALPPDLLLAAAGLQTPDPLTISPILSSLLADRGFAEVHLHLGATATFDMLWSATLVELSKGTTKENAFESPGAEFQEGRLLAPWLLRAAITRLLLAAFLRSSTRWKGLLFFLQDRHEQLVQRFGVRVIFQMFSAVKELRQGSFSSESASFIDLSNVYNQFIQTSNAFTPGASDLSNDNLDPICQWFPAHEQSEFHWCRAGFEYMRQENRSDSLFAKLFWQCIRMRVAFYRHIVQRPMTPGLQFFVRTFGRLEPARKSISSERLLKNLVNTAHSGLKSLEVRLQPRKHMSELCKLVCYIDSAVKTINSRRKNDAAQMNEKRQSHATDLEVGVVFHFSRSRGKQSRSGTPAAWGANSNSSPNDELNGTGYRYSGYYFENQKQAAALANLITTFPRTLELVRGVDLCSDELGIALWVVKGLIDHVINSAEAAIRLVPDLRLRIKRALRITIHAGEDYVHLLGGIRRVSEALEFLPLHEGDRVGHAIALGVDVESWSMSVHTIPVTLEERLLDLIWLWRLAMRSTAIPELRAWIPWVREHLDQLSLRAFGHSGGPYSPAMLSEFQCMLHDPRTLREVGFPSGPMRNNFSSKSHEMIFKWITNRSLFRRIQQLIDVDVRAEASLIAAAQKQVRIDVGRLGIAIEINPSSNLLVGHIGSLEDHPLWRLRPIDRERLKSEPVRVCIGSDDPATFATSLANEYQLVFDAMTEAGYSSEECDAWINDVRQTGLDCRFTIPRSNHDLLIPVNYGSSPLYW